MAPSQLPPSSRRKHSSPLKPGLASPTSLPPPLKRQKVVETVPVSPNGQAHIDAEATGQDGDDGRTHGGIETPSERNGTAGAKSTGTSTNGKGKGKAVSDVGSPSPAGTPNGSEGWAPVMSKEAKAKLKKKQKMLQLVAENPAEFHFDTRGFKNRTVQLKDVRDLVMHITSDERAPNWMVIKNKRSINKTVVVMIPGITPAALGVTPTAHSSMPFPIASTSASLPTIQQLFSHACPTKAAGERYRMHSCMATFMSCPMSTSARARRDDERRRMTQSEESKDPTSYLLPAEAMLEQGYPPTVYPHPVNASLRQAARRFDPVEATDPAPPAPFEAWQQADGWVQTPAPPEWNGELVGRPMKVLGVDCEMCLAKSGSILARVSVVDASGSPIYDSLVKPSEPIADYVTRFSGITAERLEGVTTTLEDVQRKLAEFIDFDTVLVGHSLECDLRVLKLAHPWVIDTSVIYNHPKGPPYKPSLKWLVQKWLGYEIQKARPLSGANGETDNQVIGHDSEEDARAAVELLQKKLEKGPGFGEFQNDSEAIFDRMARGPDSKVAAVVDHGAPGQWMAGRAKTSLGFRTDDEVVDGIIGSIDEHDFLFGRMMDLSHALGWSTLPVQKPAASDADAQPDEPDREDPESKIEATYSRLDQNLARLHESLPKGTALVIFTGHSDPREMSRLAQKKAKFDRLFKTQAQSTIEPEDRWMGEDDRALMDAVERCKVGLSFFRIR